MVFCKVFFTKLAAVRDLKAKPRAFSTGDGWAHGHSRRPRPTDGHPEKTGHEEKSDVYGHVASHFRLISLPASFLNTSRASMTSTTDQDAEERQFFYIFLPPLFSG